MLRLTLKALWAHKRRLVGTALAVVLGVAFLSGTLVLGDTMRRSFETLFADANAGSDAVVRSASELADSRDSAPAVIDETLVDQIAVLDGVDAAAPYVEGFGAIIGEDGSPIGGNGPPQVAGSWIEDPELNPYRLVEGRAPETSQEVVLNAGAAEDAGLSVGDRAVIQAPQPVDVEIVGIAKFGDQDGLGAATFTAFTVEGAQEHVTKQPDRVSTVYVRGDGVSQSELVLRIARLLPSGLEAVTGERASDEELDAVAGQFLNLFTAILTGFAAIALLVATFSINNAFSIVGAQRARESAMLRTLGATRRQVLGSVVGEAATLGLVASVIGVLAGIGLTQLLKLMFRVMGFAMPAEGTVLRPSSLLVALGVGVFVTTVAAVLPAVRSSRVPPLAALRDVATDGAGAMRRRHLVVTTLIRVLGWPLRWRGVPGRLALRNALRNPRRTAGTATALLLGVGVTTLLVVGIASLRDSVEEAAAASVNSDLVVASGGFDSTVMSPDVAGAIAELPEVASATGLGRGSAVVDESASTLTVVDPSAAGNLLNLDESEGSLAKLADGEIAVEASRANDAGWSVGDVVSTEWPDGSSGSLRVGAVYEQDEIVGSYVVTRGTWQPYELQAVDYTVLVDVAAGQSLAGVQPAVSEVSESMGAPEALTRSEFVEDRTSFVDTILTLTYAMLALGVLIAVMGVANAMALAVHERVREIGLLRAVGALRGQVRGMVRWESTLVALLGTTVGAALGVVAGWLLVRSAESYGFTAYAVPLGTVAAVVVIGALAGILAAARPARRAAGLDVLQAVEST